jgi:hypothetical protein
LDTGVAETSIFSLENKEIKLAMLKNKFSGLGGSASIDGFRSDNNIAKIGKDYVNTFNFISLPIKILIFLP